MKSTLPKITMKYLIICLLAITNCSAKVYAQTLIRLNGEDIIYTQLENKIEIAAFGYNCTDIDLIIQNCKVEKKSCGDYVVICDTIGYTNYKVTTKRNHKVQIIDSGRIYINPIPDSKAWIASKRNDSIPLNVFKAQQGIISYFHFLGYCGNEIITEFNYIILRGQNVIASGFNNRNIFNEQIKADIEILKSGDVISFFNIKGLRGTSFKTKIEPFELYITN